MPYESRESAQEYRCPTCDGTGRCVYCNGKGCDECRHSGKCTACDGRGQ